jgi:hypothetical protein
LGAVRFDCSYFGFKLFGNIDDEAGGKVIGNGVVDDPAGTIGGRFRKADFLYPGIKTGFGN